MTWVDPIITVTFRRDNRDDPQVRWHIVKSWWSGQVTPTTKREHEMRHVAGGVFDLSPGCEQVEDVVLKLAQVLNELRGEAQLGAQSSTGTRTVVDLSAEAAVALPFPGTVHEAGSGPV